VERAAASPSADANPPQARGADSLVPRQERAAALVKQEQRPRVPVSDLPRLPPELWIGIASYIGSRREAVPDALATSVERDAKKLTAVFDGLGGDEARMIASTAIDLSCNTMAFDEVEALAMDTTIISLRLRGCSIRDSGATDFSENTTLRLLHLGSNEIRDLGAISLASNSNFDELDLSDNLIRDPGVQALAAHSRARSLNLSDNFFSDIGALALPDNEFFESLDISGNGVEGSDEEIKGVAGGIANLGALMERFARNTTLMSLGLDRLGLTDDHIQKLMANTSLTSLSARGNKIGDAGVMAILANPRVTTLDLRDNMLSPSAKAALEAARGRFEKLEF